MPVLTCTCGTQFTSARSNAKYCSDRCRKRTKRSGADVLSLPAVLSDEGAGPIERATRAALEAAGRLNTWLASTAIKQAQKLDHGAMETGSGYAALSREYRATMAEATRGVKSATAPEQLQDELAARRAQHGA